MSRRRRNETDEQRARRELISDFLSAANIQSMRNNLQTGLRSTVTAFSNFTPNRIMLRSFHICHILLAGRKPENS